MVSDPGFACPKCGTAQEKGTRCIRCGVIFARVRDSGPSPRPQPHSEPHAPSRSPPRPPAAQPARGGAIPFATGLGRALIVPFLGKGALWIPLLVAVLIVSSLPLFPFRRVVLLAFIGSLASYFANALAVGLDGEVRPLALPRLESFRASFVLPGLALLGLTAVLFALPVYLGVKLVARGVETAVETVQKTESAARRADGEAGRAAKSAPPEDAQPTIASYARSAPKGLLALFILTVLLPFLYLPMALAVAASGDNLFRIVNPIEVFGAAIRGGGKYFGIVLIGVGAIIAFFLISLVASSAGSNFAALIVLFSGLGYTVAVQGYLLGWLIREDRDILPELAPED